MSIEVERVVGRRGRRRFLEFEWSVYRNDPLWVPPIIKDQVRALDPDRGGFFERGRADLFLAKRGGRTVGRICSAEDPPTNQSIGRKDALIGFFECIDDQEVAAALFDTAGGWANDRGLDHLFGPFDLDYENSHGILIEKRDRPAAIMCGHSPPHYQRLFENYGFEKARGDSLAFAVSVLPEENPNLARLSRLAGIARRRGRVAIRNADLSDFDAEIDRIHDLLVRSLAHLPGSLPWRRDVLARTLEPLRRIVDPELILFAMVDGKEVGWFPGIRNLNELLIRCNGLRYPWDYLRLLRHMGEQPECLAVKSVVVLPEYWNTGVAILLFDEMVSRSRAKGYRWLDLSLTAEDNPQTPLIAENYGAHMYKRYRVFRKRIELNRSAK